MLTVLGRDKKKSKFGHFQFFIWWSFQEAKSPE